MIIATVRMCARTEKKFELIQTLLSWLKVVRNQQGCISCRLAEDLEDDGVLWLVEEWDTQVSLDQHMRSPSFSILMGATSLLRRSHEITLHAV